MELDSHFIYFKINDIIKRIEMPQFGQILLKCQNGTITASEVTDRKQYNKNAD